MKFSYPTKSTLQITQAWGNVNFALYPAPTGRHMGVDIGGYVGAPIYAACNGVVTEVVMINTHGYGRHVIIHHPSTASGVPLSAQDGAYDTLYAHLHKVNVAVGQAVVGGQQIGEMGGQPGDDDPIDGASSGSHLHFEVIVPSQPNFDFVKTFAGYTVDPLLYLTRLAYGDPKSFVTVVAPKGVRVRDDSNTSGVQIGTLESKKTYPIFDVMEVGNDLWAQLWSLRDEYAAVRYQGETLMSVTAGTVVVNPLPPALDETSIRKDEIDRMMAYLQFRRNEL